MIMADLELESKFAIKIGGREAVRYGLYFKSLGGQTGET